MSTHARRPDTGDLLESGQPDVTWTRDFGRARRMSKRLDFGCVWINTHIPLVAEMPHGGFTHSGHGKDLSADSLEDYTRINGPGERCALMARSAPRMRRSRTLLGGGRSEGGL